MDNSLITAFLLGACVVGCGAGVVWQVLRRKPAAARRIERVGARPKFVRVPEAPKPEPEAARPTVGVLRPDMLAFTTVAGDVTSAELFVQRALEIELPGYREVVLQPHEKQEFDGIFAHNAVLAWEPEDEFAADTYAVSFSPVIENALAAGFEPRVNATSNDLSVIALREGVEMGEPMSAPDYSWGGPQAVHRLFNLLDPAEQKHELEGELRKELDVIEERLRKLKLFIPAVRGHEWKHRWDELFDLSRDVRRLGLEEGRAQERTERADRLAAAMRAVNARIDTALKTYVNTIRTADEADHALTESIALMDEREVAVLFLRAIALMRVIASDDYIHGMRCSSRIALNVQEFPSVHPLLDKSRNIALQALEVESRGMNEAQMTLVASVKKDADRLADEHDAVVARLEKDVARLQKAIDRHLILQGKRRRYAVRMTPDNRVDALLVLER